MIPRPDGFPAPKTDAGSPLIAAVPGGGWLIEVTEAGGRMWVEPVVAWTIDANGRATPLVMDDDGCARDAREIYVAATYRIYHLDTKVVTP